MGQKQGKKWLHIYEEDAAGGIAFAESKVEQRKLCGKDNGDDHQLWNLSFFNAERSSGDSGPQKNRDRGDAESDPRRGEHPQTVEADLNGHGIGTKEHADEYRKNGSPKRKVFIFELETGNRFDSI